MLTFVRLGPARASWCDTAVEDVAWSPVEPNVLMSVGCDSTVRVWDVRRFVCVQVLEAVRASLPRGAQVAKEYVVGLTPGEALGRFCGETAAPHPNAPWRYDCSLDS